MTVSLINDKETVDENNRMNERSSELYFNPKFPASLSSLQKFYREAK